MSKRSLATRLASLLRRRLGEAGSAALSFALLAPMLVALSAGIIEFTLIAFDYSRANEATRRAVRIAIMGNSIADLTNLENGDVVCKSTSGTVSCTGATVEDSTAFDAIANSAHEVLPDIAPQNIQVTYSFSGKGTFESGGILPLVTISLKNLKHTFFLLNLVPGMPVEMTFPPFSATNLAAGYTPP